MRVVMETWNRSGWDEIAIWKMQMCRWSEFRSENEYGST
jgi:hypothetical protein